MVWAAEKTVTIQKKGNKNKYVQKVYARFSNGLRSLAGLELACKFSFEEHNNKCDIPVLCNVKVSV